MACTRAARRGVITGEYELVVGRGEHTREGDAQHVSATPAAAQAAFAHGPRAVLPTDDFGQRVRQEPPTNDEYISAHPTELVAPYLGLKHLFLLTCSDAIPTLLLCSLVLP